MSVFRIEKTKDYTVMSNYHLRDTKLSLKAKGMLSLMLSLPENRDYTTKGLASICKDGIDSICSTVNELKKAGYIKRSRVRNTKGQLTSTEYVIYESPKPENPVLDNPIQAKPVQEKHAQLNTNILNTKESNIDISYPIISENDGMGTDKADIYRDIVKSNIEYEILKTDRYINLTLLDEIVDILTETVSTSKKRLTVASDEYPSELVKAKLLKLNSTHIRYVIDCMKENTADIRNIKKYLLATLFNAPSTIEHYYTSKVNHDLYSPDR